MKIRTWALSAVLACGLSTMTSSIAQDVNVDDLDIGGSPIGSGTTTPELMASAIAHLYPCLEYCINGISLYFVPTPTGGFFYWTLRVSHNSPDLFVTSYNEMNDSPWLEYNLFFGEPVKKVIDTAIAPVFGGLVTEVGNDRYMENPEWGNKQAIRLHESFTIGHPGSLILRLFDANGLKPSFKEGPRDEQIPCKTPGCLEDQRDELGQAIRQELGEEEGPPNDTAENYLNSWPAVSSTPNLIKAFGGNMKGIEQVLKNTELVQSITKVGQGALEAASKLGVSTPKQLFCETEVTPFIPMYLSSVDAFFWRAGFPFTDIPYALTILNPISNDGITHTSYLLRGTDRQIKLPPGAHDPEKYIPINEKLGHIFPREGTVNHHDSTRSSVVIAKRNLNIVYDRKNPALRIKRGSAPGIRAYIKNYPQVVTDGSFLNSEGKLVACTTNITNTIFQNQESDRDKYGWTAWPNYTCDLDPRGIKIKTVGIPQICLTPKIP